MLGKKGSEDNIVLELIIFIILNIAFIAGMLLFVYSSSHSAAVYEQAYAKEIALLIDNARPGMEIILYMDELRKYVSDTNTLANIFRIDNNRVYVSLEGKGGYSYQYFSDYALHIEYYPKFPIKLKISVKNA